MCNEKCNNLDTSEKLDQLIVAMVEVNKVLENASKDSKNPFFKSKYADLTAIWGVCRKPLYDNGLFISQPTKVINEKLYLETRLLHKSGQWMRGIYPIEPVKNDPQGYGSALTYARRYSLSAMLGITAEDDDGNIASGVDKKNYIKTEPAKKVVNPLANKIKNMALELSNNDKEKAKDLLVELTSFGDKKGRYDIENSSDKQLDFLNKKLQELLKEKQEISNVDDEDIKLFNG